MANKLKQQKQKPNPLENAQKIATYLVIAAASATLLLLFRTLFSSLNVFLIDHAGHIASAESFARFGFHHLNPRAFLGYVQNLFYPPMGDMLIAGTSRLFNVSVESAYPFYLSAVALAYILSLASVIQKIQTAWARIWMGALFLYLFWMFKDELLDYQGLSFVDLTITGLGSQFLGGIFFWLLVRETLNRYRWRWVAAFMSLTLLSHLVMGLVAALYLGLWIFSSKYRETLKAATTSLALTTFFWLPFLTYKDYITSSKIFTITPYLFFSIALYNLSFAWKHEKTRVVTLASVLLFSPMVFGPHLEAMGFHLPYFHYYRLAIIALLLLIVAMATWLDSGLKKRFALAGIAALTLSIGVNFKLKWPDLKAHEFQPSTLDLSQAGPPLKGYGREWIVDANRSFGFGIDSIMSVRDPHFQSVKGLFWESARSNTVLSSYFATLVGYPVVLDYRYFYQYPCTLQACLMDRFFEDYNIQRVSIENSFKMIPGEADRQACFYEIFNRSRTNNYQFEKSGTLRVNEKTYSRFDLNPISDLRFRSNEVISLIPFKRIQPLQTGATPVYEQVMNDRMNSCVQAGVPSTIFVEASTWQKIRMPLASDADPSPLDSVQFKELTHSRFEITVNAKGLRWIWLKLSLQPGFRLFDQNGVERYIYQTFPGVLLHLSEGTYTLTHTLPPASRIGLFLSALSIIVIAAFLLVTRKRS